MTIRILFGLCLFILLCSAGPALAEESCRACHTEFGEQITKNPHVARGMSCASCHGAAQQHVEDPTQRDFVNFKDKKQVEAINAACLRCHAKGQKQMHWDGSAHQTNDVSCTSCHTVHNKAPRSVPPEKCYTCHKDVRRDAGKFSHHPVREGKMQCASCHNVHGSLAPSLLKKSTVNELCISCHVEKRGPYRFAHAPVEENCLTCHTPHGSSNPRLMAQNVRATCSNCHVFGRKRDMGTGAIGSRSPSMMVRGSCLTCHGDIHGSNTDYHFR